MHMEIYVSLPLSALATTAPLLFEEITHTGRADPRENLHELRRGDAEEGHAGLALTGTLNGDLLGHG